MKSSIIILSLLSGVVLANPVQKRQDLPFDGYDAIPYLPDVAAPPGDAAPQTDTYDATSVASAAISAITDAPSTATEIAVEKRAVTCTTRSYNGPQVASPSDSPEAFQSYGPFAAAATAAAQPNAIPSGYGLVPDFVNLGASISDSHYLTYTTKDISSYDPSICSAKCDAMPGCYAFNMYYERVPLIVSTITQVPDSNICPGLTTSPSATLLKCAFYGSVVKADQATNVGQYQGKFHVVIAGSNAYVKVTAPTLPGFQGPVAFGGAINAPAPVNTHGYLRSQTFGQNVPYDPSLCAASCAAQTEYNAAHTYVNLGPCVFFDVYVLEKNGENGILTCVYYSTPYGTEYATNVGQYDSQGNFYSINNSNGYYLDGFFVD